MPLFLDVHRIDAVDPDALAGAHERDTKVQEKYGVHYLNYWFSQNPGRVYCLVEAPDKAAAEAVHREAHGMIADEVVEVQQGR